MGGRARAPVTPRNDAVKNFGDAHRVPFVVACCRWLVLFLFCSFLFGCHGSILPFHSSWNFRNGVLLQLFECIESTQNEVKRKMMGTSARNDAPRSPARRARAKKVRMTTAHACSLIGSRVPSADFNRKLRSSGESSEGFCAI